MAHAAGGLPNLAAVALLHRAQAPSHFTYVSHAAFWIFSWFIAAVMDERRAVLACCWLRASSPDAATSKSAQHFFDGGNSYVEEGLTPPWLGLSSPEEVISPNKLNPAAYLLNQHKWIQASVQLMP